MKKQSIVKNYLYNVSYQILMIIVPFITTPYVSRVIGVEGIGSFSYVNSIASYYTIIAVLGTGVYGQREIARCRNDKQLRSVVFWNTVSLRLITTMIALVLYLPLVLYQSKERTLFIILALNIISTAFDISWFFQGLEEFQKVVVRNAFFKIINVLFVFKFIKSSNDLYVYIMGQSVITAISCLSLWPSLARCILPAKGIRPFTNIKGVLELFLPTIAFQIYSYLDKTMIGRFSVTSVDNGCYEQAEKIVFMVKTVVTSMTTVMLPRMAYIIRENNNKQTSEYLYKSYEFVWFVGSPMVLGLIGIADVFIPLFLGSGFEKAVYVTQILSPIIIITSISGVVGFQYLIASGKQNIYTVVVFIICLGNFLLNCILIPRYLAIGAAYGTLVSETIGCVLLLMYMTKNRIWKVNAIINKGIKPLLASCIMYSVIMGVKQFLSVGWSMIFVMVFVGAATYLVMLLILRTDIIVDFVNGYRIKQKWTNND